MDSIIQVSKLRKSYGKKVAVNNIDFQINRGEIVGLLGPNGAGKTTVISMLSTVLSPDRGSILIDNEDILKHSQNVKNKIGIVPQELAIYEEVTAEKNVKFFASLYKLDRNTLHKNVKDALKMVGLYEKRNDKPKTFSGGMKRRLNIACAIAHNPKVIIMDEPTVGIDPQSRNHILESIRKLREKGATIIYSTHYMEEVEAIADRIIIMNEGDIIAEGRLEELTTITDNEYTYMIKITNPEYIDNKKLEKLTGVNALNCNEEGKLKVVVENAGCLAMIIENLNESHCNIKNIECSEASLETVFLKLTGKNLRD